MTNLSEIDEIIVLFVYKGTLGARGYSCAVSGFVSEQGEKNPLVPRVVERLTG